MEEKEKKEQRVFLQALIISFFSCFPPQEDVDSSSRMQAYPLLLRVLHAVQNDGLKRGGYRMEIQRYVQIHPNDNVLVALETISKGEVILHSSETICLKDTIPKGHKFSISNIEEEDTIVKYGYPIGKATQAISKGMHVHTHNMKTSLQDEEKYAYSPVVLHSPFEKKENLTFQGYKRENGEVGIRNEVWIVNTVGCINKVAENLAKLANSQFAAPNFDGFHHFSHPYGCSQLGDDLTYTQKILADLVQHPNAGGVLVIGLGCENNYIDFFKKSIHALDLKRIKFLNVQEVEDEMELGLELLEELFAYVTAFKRTSVPISCLKVGLKCRGSDGFSGITANPLLGTFSDQLIAHGGTTVLTEVPEMFGAETILMNRSKNEEVFEKTVRLINDFKHYFMKYNQPVFENPSPGNKQGGITTLEEKSLGCIQKGGFAPVQDVLQYGDRVTSQGLHLLQGPGNDLVSVTALAASGCQIVLFTTGRGTPFGGPTPTIKVSTNSALFHKKKNWMDFNAGSLVEGATMTEVASQFFSYILNVAEGKSRTNNERNGFREIAIFKDGVTM